MEIDERFTNHGTPVKDTAENRSSVITKNDKGQIRMILFAGGFLMNVDLECMCSVQQMFPDGEQGFPFGSFCSRSGKVYAGAGNLFFEYDAFEGTFSFWKTLRNTQVAGWCFCEDEDGVLWFGSLSYPGCRLFSFDPVEKKVRDFGQMDDYGAYMDHIGVDRYGWVYMGVGTAKKGIVAYHPKTEQKRVLFDERERTRGSAYVHTGKDGRIYGHTRLPDVGFGFVPEDRNPSINWCLLEEGRATPVDPEQVPDGDYYHHRHSFMRIHSPLIDASFIKSYNLAMHEVTYEHPSDKKTVTIDLDYETKGANLSPMTAGPDGKLYGTSNHPMHGYRYDPSTDTLTDFGAAFYEDAGGGNICAYAVIGDMIGGAAYYGGKIHLLDTSKPFYDKNEANESVRNPRLVAQHTQIIRPRCATAHVDGETMIFGGFGENGGTGGGLCIYNIKTGQDLVLENNEILLHHSTLCMRVMQNGNLIGGTSTASPCGGIPKAKEAKLYLMDWNTKKVVKHDVPVPEQREIALMEIDQEQKIHAITDQSIYFVFDPVAWKTLHVQPLEDFGSPVRDGLVKGPDSLLYGLCTHAIYAIDTQTYEVKRFAKVPFAVRSGMAFLQGRVYFASESRLMSYLLPAFDAIE